MSLPTSVHVEVASPMRFDRTTLLVRFLLAIALGFIGITGGWLMCLLYLVLPLIAAISILSIGTQRFRDEVAPKVTRGLSWLLAFDGFMLLLTDRFPGKQPEVHVELPFSGTPTATTALVRLVTSIPSGLVLALLSFVSGILWVIGALAILFGLYMPRAILAYQRGILRWRARLFAYHASLVEDYPPFRLDTDYEDHEPLAASEAR